MALSAVLLSGCYSAGDGVSPPLQSLYFPTGLATDAVPSDDPAQPAPATHLFIASSDFDLQYNSSALAAYSLEALRPLVPSADAPARVPLSCNVDADCAGVVGLVCDNDIFSSPAPSYFCVDQATHDPCNGRGVNTPADQVLYPGLCKSIDTRLPEYADIIKNNYVEIGAFATDVVFKPTPKTALDTDPADKGRLFLPVRGDATLHWVDIGMDGSLHCNANPNDQSCDDVHRVGNDEYTESPNLLRQEPEPFAIAVDEAGKNIAITNQTTGSVSLYVNDWRVGMAPQLVYLLSGLPSAPVGIVSLPTPKPFDPNYEPGFLAVYSDAPQVDLLRVHADAPVAGEYAVQVLTRAASVGINANSGGTDSRGIVIDDSQRKADYAQCDLPCANPLPAADAPSDVAAAGLALFDSCESKLDPTCFQAAHQANVFVSNRAPASLLVGALTPDFSYASGTSELPAFTDSIPLNVGPSRVVFGRVKVPSQSGPTDIQGHYALEPRVFVVCFDSRRIYIYDPVRHVIDSIVTTGRGPFALAIDEQRGLGFIAHFTDSYLGVISLDQRFPQNYAAIVASVGVPSAPRASK